LLALRATRPRRADGLEPQAQLSWTGPGFALEATTNASNPQPGPWFEAPNMANPFVVDLNQPYRLFRLRK
jgi:hypothetical protein